LRERLVGDSLMRWCLVHGLRITQPLTLMTIGLYNEPAGAWLPSILLAGCLVALMYLLETSGVATAGYDIQRLQVERADWPLRNEQLRLELAKRQSLTWIDAEATTQLGMVHAAPTALVYLKASR